MYDFVSRADVLTSLKYCEDPIKAIENLPTFSMNVRWGQWVWSNDKKRMKPYKVCSLCDYVPTFNPYNSGQILTRYCSHCGARMVK